MESPKVKVLDGADAPERWIMMPPDRALVMTKHHANRLGFAVLLAFFRDRGRFPGVASDVDRLIVEEIARQLAIEVQGEPRSGTAPRSEPCWASGKQPLPTPNCSKSGCEIECRQSGPFRTNSPRS